MHKIKKTRKDKKDENKTKRGEQKFVLSSSRKKQVFTVYWI